MKIKEALEMLPKASHKINFSNEIHKALAGRDLNTLLAVFEQYLTEILNAISIGNEDQELSSEFVMAFNAIKEPGLLKILRAFQDIDTKFGEKIETGRQEFWAKIAISETDRGIQIVASERWKHSPRSVNLVGLQRPGKHASQMDL